MISTVDKNGPGVEMANDENAITDPRRAFLIETIKFDQLKGLEIGPLNEPLVTNEDLQGQGEIFYLDHLSTDELKEKYSDDPSVDVENIVNVDFVCPDGDLLEAVSGNQFDYVVASHVIEHVPNILKFLQGAQKVLKSGGKLFLIIPDKRFTFDYERRETTFGDVLDSFLSDDTKPSVRAVYDHFAKAVEINAHEAWHGLLDGKQSKKLFSSKVAWDLANDVNRNKTYHDVHLNIFTPQSFFEILERAILHNIVNFEVERFEDTEVGSLEFSTILKNSGSISDEEIVKKCLRTLPDIRLENVLSPYMPQVKALSNAVESSTRVVENLQKEVTELRMEIKKNREVIQNLQKVLDRKSVKLVLSLVHNCYDALRGKVGRG